MTEHKSKISKETAILMGKIKADLSIDKSNGTGSGGTTAYADNLPPTVTMEQVEAIGDYNKQFIPASILAFSDLAIDAMADNKELKEATISIPMGPGDEVTHTILRSRTSPNNFAKDGQPATVTKFGPSISCYTVNAGKLGGDLKHAREAIIAEATKRISDC